MLWGPSNRDNIEPMSQASALRPPDGRRVAIGINVSRKCFALCGALFVGGALVDLPPTDFAVKFELP